MRFALIGDPVAQSPSPAMHSAAFRELGLPHTYEAIRVGPGELETAWPRLREELAGMNVTTPHKQAVLPLLDELTPTAHAAGSVNTVVLKGDHALGDSTDGAGFLAALDGATVGRSIGRALVLGAGGAARAVASALTERGTAVTVAGRRPDAIRRLGDELGVDITLMNALDETLASADLLVNAAPISDESLLPDDLALPLGLVVFDLVYRPRRTPLLVRAEREGCVTIEGVDMLVEQGARSFELWTGQTAPIEEMRAAAFEALTVAPSEAR